MLTTIKKMSWVFGATILLLCGVHLTADNAAEPQELTEEELAYEPTVEVLLEVERLDSGYLDISWGDLIPEGWIEPMPAPVDWGLSDEELLLSMNGNAFSTQTVGPTVSLLDGEKVRIPGFVLTLDMSVKGIKEFLFVPYVGACLHVPPPPTNQLIAAVSDEYITGVDTWAPVFLFGTLNVKEEKSELGNSSYTLNIDYIENYREY